MSRIRIDDSQPAGNRSNHFKENPVDLEPPYELTLPAPRHWDRLAKQIHAQGRWDVVSHDLLASFCQLLHLSQECLDAILADGVVVAGSRSDRDRVRHPLWTPYSRTQANLVRLARSIPLVDPKVDHSGATIDSWLDEMMADE